MYSVICMWDDLRIETLVMHYIRKSSLTSGEGASFKVSCIVEFSGELHKSSKLQPQRTSRTNAFSFSEDCYLHLECEAPREGSSEASYFVLVEFYFSTHNSIVFRLETP